MFECELCNKEFKLRKYLDQHKNKKIPCNIKTNYQCSTCKKFFRQKRSLLEHLNNNICNIDTNQLIVANNDLKNGIKSCLNSNIDNDNKIKIFKKYNNLLDDENLLLILNSDMDLNGKVSMISTMINNTKPTISNINNGTITTENSNNITNNIQINNFGQENLDYLDKEYFKNLIMNQHIEKGYVQLIKDIYLNKEHPENKTVKVENINNKYALVFNNDKWDTMLKADLKEMLHKKNYTILKMHYNKLKKSMSVPKREETMAFLSRDETGDPHMMYVIDKIILLFYNDGEGDDMPDKYKIGKNTI
jgi:hypothetical protein